MKRGGGLLPARPDCWPPTKRPRATPGGLIADSVTCLSRQEGVAPVLAHVPSFGRNPRGSPDFLAYPVPKACMHVLGTRVPRRLGVARSAWSPKAAQALGCSLTPGLRISFGRVTCMARAASVPGLWALGFLVLCGVCVWVRLGVGCGFRYPRQSWLGSWVGVSGHGLWCCPSSVGCLWCSWLGFGFGLLMGRVSFRGRPACPPPFLVPACGVGVCAGPGSRLCPALLGWVVRVCFWRFCFFLFFSCPGLCGPCPSIPFLSGWAGGSLFFFFSFRCPFSRWAALPGLVLPVLGGWSPCASLGVLSSVPSGGGFGRLWCCWRAVWRLWAVFVPFPPPPTFFFGGGGLPVPPSAFPGLAHAVACIRLSRQPHAIRRGRQLSSTGHLRVAGSGSDDRPWSLMR